MTKWRLGIQLNFAEIILNLKQCSPHEFFLGGVKLGGISFISIVSPGHPTVRQTNTQYQNCNSPNYSNNCKRRWRHVTQRNYYQVSYQPGYYSNQHTILQDAPLQKFQLWIEKKEICRTWKWVGNRYQIKNKTIQLKIRSKWFSRCIRMAFRNCSGVPFSRISTRPLCETNVFRWTCFFNKPLLCT